LEKGMGENSHRIVHPKLLPMDFLLTRIDPLVALRQFRTMKCAQ
jgi:hypothetical protein